MTDATSLVKLSQFSKFENKPDATRLACSPCAGWAAHRAVVDKLNVRPGDRIAIIGAAGDESFSQLTGEIGELRAPGVTRQWNHISYQIWPVKPTTLH